MADTTSAAPSEPVAGQCRFVGAKWSECAVEHVAMVLANPAEWEGYEVRYLYAAPQPVVREPLTALKEASMAKFKGRKLKHGSIAQPPIPKPCAACNGSGRYDSTGSPKCSACNGTGIKGGQRG